MTMRRYTVDTAVAGDDAALRALMEATPMRGAVSVAFTREPSFFEGQVVLGRFCQTMVLREGEDGPGAPVLGMAERSVRQRYVNGEEVAVGYLSGLRLRETQRRATFLARGFVRLREWHADGRAGAYVTTIAADNEGARRVLTSRRAGLPTYQAAGLYHTCVMSLRGQRRGGAKVEVRTARAEDVGEMVAFVQRVGRRRQLFPAYGREDFFMMNGTFKGLMPEDIFLAMDGDRIVGMLAAWDQRGFRQNRIAGYSRGMRLARPFYNLVASWRGLPRLPGVGAVLNCVTGALPLVEGDDPRVFEALLEAVIAARSGGEWDYLMVGMHESDPLWPTLSAMPARRYTTCVYLVYWDKPGFVDSMDGRPWYLELGAL